MSALSYNSDTEPYDPRQANKDWRFHLKCPGHYAEKALRHTQRAEQLRMQNETDVSAVQILRAPVFVGQFVVSTLRARFNQSLQKHATECHEDVATYEMLYPNGVLSAIAIAMEARWPSRQTPDAEPQELQPQAGDPDHIIEATIVPRSPLHAEEL